MLAAGRKGEKGAECQCAIRRSVPSAMLYAVTTTHEVATIEVCILFWAWSAARLSIFIPIDPIPVLL